MMKTLRKMFGLCVVVSMLAITVSAGVGLAAEYTGTVEQKGEAVVLFTPDETYVLKGDEMLPQMVGKKVTITGSIEEFDIVKVLTVEKFEEVKE